MEEPFLKASRQERPPIEIKVAQPEDWQAYKSLRLESISGGDSQMFGGNWESENLRTEEEWRTDLSKSDDFTIL
ncbi:MAG TPA: hypothetical protein VEA37_05390, partial [Flavobacterium sp.]|nr:hypothetical protein [Flavobacterium sp.]